MTDDKAIYIKLCVADEGDALVFHGIADSEGKLLQLGERIESDVLPKFSSIRITLDDVKRVLILPPKVRRAVLAGSIRYELNEAMTVGVWEVKATPGLLGWALCDPAVAQVLREALVEGVIKIDDEGKAYLTELEPA